MSELLTSSSYATLGLSSTATDGEILKNYWEFRRKLEEELKGTEDASDVLRIEKDLSLLQQAYNVLSNEVLKAEYDASLEKMSLS